MVCQRNKQRVMVCNEITTKQNETFVLLEDVLSMQPRASSGKGKTREQIIGEMAKSLEE